MQLGLEDRIDEPPAPPRLDIPQTEIRARGSRCQPLLALFELALCAPSIADIADSGDDKQTVWPVQRTQTDFDRYERAILSTTLEFECRAHPARRRGRDIGIAPTDMARTQRLRHEHLDV